MAAVADKTPADDRSAWLSDLEHQLSAPPTSAPNALPSQQPLGTDLVATAQPDARR